MISVHKTLLPYFFLTTLLLFSCGEQESKTNPLGSVNGIDSLQILVEQYPDSLEIQLALQEKIYANGDTAMALKNLLALEQKHKNQIALYNAIAYLQLQNGDTTNAIDALVHSLSINQIQPDIEFELAFVEAARGNKVALVIADKMINQYGEKEIEAKAHFTKGIYYANTQLPAKAIQEFDSSILKNFTLVDAYIEKGILQFELGETEKSIQTLSKGAELDKNNADIFFWLGMGYKQKKADDKALLYFSETLKLDPNYTAASNAIIEIKKQ